VNIWDGFLLLKVHPNKSLGIMKQYKIILIISLLWGNHNVFSQSFIEPFIGMDYSQIKTEPLFKELGIFEIYDSGYSQKSLFYGIRAEHYISEKIALSLQLSYTKKEVNAAFSYAAPVEGFDFNYFRSSLKVKFYPSSLFYIGIGPTFNYIYRINHVFTFKDRESNFLLNKKEYGAMLFSGLAFRNFTIELNYGKGFKFAKNDDTYHHFEPISSIGISLGYQLKISPKKR